MQTKTLLNNAYKLLKLMFPMIEIVTSSNKEKPIGWVRTIPATVFRKTNTEKAPYFPRGY